MNLKNSKVQNHKEGSIRHAEKRRTGTCLFADRVARASIQAFAERVPEEWRSENKPVCLATFVAHFDPSAQRESLAADDCGHLQVIALGVGTKYLSEDTISSEQLLAINYGRRVRDLHAEVLARRALRRFLLLEMQSLVQESGLGSTDSVSNNSSRNGVHRPILQLDGCRFSLVDGVTIHMYTSSTPCGNSSLKKFAKMAKENFDSSLGPDEWYEDDHSKNPVPSHSLHLGNFSLLVKKDYSCKSDVDAGVRVEKLSHLPKKQKSWPANLNDDWCPPGTSLPHFGKGSIHTCSDKICRWNMLGLQGSLLASLLHEPIHMTSITIGRKFTRCIAQRALCCRAVEVKKKKRNKEAECSESENTDEPEKGNPACYALNHTCLMGTGVYLDDSGKLTLELLNHNSHKILQ